MILVLLFVLGLIFGSFVNAVVWRTRQQAKSKKLIAGDSQLSASKNLSIFTGRSQCVHCKHVLAPQDLVPVLSWLALRGRCRYCKKSISMQYPLVELALGLVFAATYHYWPVPVVGGQWVLLVTWLAVSIGLLALAVYDLRWMLLPNKMLYPAAAVAAVGRVIYIVGYDTDKLQALLAWLLSVAVAGGIFWLIYELSKGRAIGFGDVRLGLVSGTVLADPILSFQMIFVASVLGTLVAIPGLLSKKQTMTSKIPYGPFLIAATFVVLLFGASFTNWYQRLLT